MFDDQLALFEPAPGIVGHAHPDTSAEAAELVAPRTGTQRRKILEFLYRSSAHGATDGELQRSLWMDGNTERPRRIELTRDGWVRDSGRRREYGGRAAIVWVLTERGCAAIEGAER